jgi:predicted branched-subunit amino acid permease
MLTILAYIVFIPALIWNVVFWGVAFGMLVEEKGYSWANFRNFRDTILSLALLLIPGVYLFGWE